ncbi:efflux RND transporter periplasmic adaptor subunit [Antarcticimicrobium luteum]|uniref:Efflux RND transporter periplasmic adaptor subunit n=1 Tax=Antarcticimicrobium luteum TaxID=2547397 RepID=A0A4R5VGN3_9RHOB|nr:efflux RND transporter periplasmic adaptor subunit [Antarcticimicrobium luteum]TDK51924.1 efflux RND transporter periplasmic adaptor subunit [Antarcticimicrobium luteum]
MRKFILASALAVFGAGMALAASEQTVGQREITEWKAVFGRVEARDLIPARSRIGGTLVSVGVTEGSAVTEGQMIAEIYDPKLNLQLDSVQGEIDALLSQLDNARTELKRGEDLLERGVTTAQRLDALRTQVEVLQNQIEATRAQKRVIEEQAAEGAVLAPIAGKVIDVPVTRGSVVMPGEVIAQIGGGGFFLRLAVPERHAAYLREGIEIRIGADGQSQPGRLAKVYPQIENGRVIADVEVQGMSSEFVNARVLVSLPVGTRSALLVPADRVETRMGLDFVTVRGPGGEPVGRAVVLGEAHPVDGVEMIEVVSGLSVGDVLVAGHE